MMVPDETPVQEIKKREELPPSPTLLRRTPAQRSRRAQQALPPGYSLPRKWAYRIELIDTDDGRTLAVEVPNTPRPVVANRRKRSERAVLAVMFPHVRTKKGRLKALRRKVLEVKRRKQHELA